MRESLEELRWKALKHFGFWRAWSETDVSLHLGPRRIIRAALNLKRDCSDSKLLLDERKLEHADRLLAEVLIIKTAERLHVIDLLYSATKLMKETTDSEKLTQS